MMISYSRISGICFFHHLCHLLFQLVFHTIRKFTWVPFTVIVWISANKHSTFALEQILGTFRYGGLRTAVDLLIWKSFSFFPRDITWVPFTVIVRVLTDIAAIGWALEQCICTLQWRTILVMRRASHRSNAAGGFAGRASVMSTIIIRIPSNKSSTVWTCLDIIAA